ANAVIRKLKNPDGKVSEGIDDYNYRLNENSRKGELFLTDEEWALLLPGAGEGAWTIRPGGPWRTEGSWVHPDVWVPLPRSEEHTSELQSRENLVCRLLLEKKHTKHNPQKTTHLHYTT